MPKLEQQPPDGRSTLSSESGRANTSPLVDSTMPGVDATQFEAIVARFEQQLVRYATRITGDVERARDCVQETFLRFCREPAIGDEPHLAQWLFTVCRRLALDTRRKEIRMKTGSDSNSAICDRADEHATSATSSDKAATSLEQEEQFARVLRLLTHLPPNQQEVVRLKFQNQLSYKQIAGVTGLTVSNVGFLLHTAIKSLRDRLLET